MNNEGMKRNEIIAILENLLEEDLKAHVMLRSKIYLNGYIRKSKLKDVYVIKDRKEGLKAFFIDDVYKVGEFTEERR